MDKIFKILVLFISLSLIFFYSGSFVQAKADDLLITSDGSIYLILTSPKKVLGLTANNGDTVETKIGQILVAPAHAQSVVTVEPKPTKDNKLDVKIETPKGSTGKSEPSKEIRKTVNQIVAEDKNKKVLFEVKSNKSDQIVINQAGVEAKTTLPIKINTLSKQVSTVVGSREVNIQILPKEAQKAAQDNGMTTNTPSNGSQNSIQLTVQNNQPVYKVTGDKKLKAFGKFDFVYPVELDISANTGKTTKVSQPFIFNVLNFLGL